MDGNTRAAVPTLTTSDAYTSDVTRRHLRWIWWTALALALIAPALLHLSGRFEPFFVYNADNLLLVELFDDLSGGGSIGNWMLPASPYFVTDWVLYGLTRLVTADPYRQLALVSFQQMLLTVLAVIAIAKRSRNEVPTAGVAAVVSTLAVFVGLGTRPAVSIATMYFRYGTFIVLLFSILVAIGFLSSRTPNRYLAISFVLTALAVLSDPIHAAWFCGPSLVAVAAASSRPERMRASVVWGVVQFIAIGTGRIVHWLIPQPDRNEIYAVGFGDSSLRAGLDGIQTATTTALDQDGAAAHILAAGAAAVFCVAAISSLRSSTRTAPQVFLATLVPLSAAAGLMGTLFLNPTIEPGVRYWMPAFLLPLLMLPAMQLPHWAESRLAFAPLLPVLGLVVTIVPLVPDLGGTNRSAQESMQCVDGHLADAAVSGTGLAGYYAGRDYRVFTDQIPAIHVVDGFNRTFPANIRVEPLSDRIFFTIDSMQRPQFNPNASLAIATGGEADHRFDCPGHVLRIWENGFERLVLDTTNERYERQACDLPRQIGTRVEREVGCVVQVSPPEAGFASFGNHTPAQIGSYDVEIRAAASVRGGLIGASFEVIQTFEFGLPAADPLLVGVLADGVTTSTFTVPRLASGRPPALEVRVISDGTASFELESVAFTRLGP